MIIEIEIILSFVRDSKGRKIIMDKKTLGRYIKFPGFDRFYYYYIIKKTLKESMNFKKNPRSHVIISKRNESGRLIRIQWIEKINREKIHLYTIKTPWLNKIDSSPTSINPWL